MSANPNNRLWVKILCIIFAVLMLSSAIYFIGIGIKDILDDKKEDAEETTTAQLYGIDNTQRVNSFYHFSA